MSGVLIVADARQGVLGDVALELVAPARELADHLGAGVSAILIGADATNLASSMAVDGVGEVLTVTLPRDDFDCDVWVQAVEAAIDSAQPEVVLCPHSADALSFSPAVSARRSLGFATDVVDVCFRGAALSARRAAFGGKLIAEFSFPQNRCTLLTVRAGVYPKSTSPVTGVQTRELAVAFDGARRVEHLGNVEAPSDDLDITNARFLLSVGRGIEDAENIPQFERLAEQLGATLASSRPLVDAGWMAPARQVGQSGKAVRPDVYLAFGISGAVQHLAGIRDAGTIIAVNTDAEAPIFSVAHFGAVADMFEVADELAALLDR